MEKVRYLRRRSYGFEYEPNKAMKRAGFCFEALGKDEAEAVRRAKEINDEWDDYRKNERPFIANVEKGDINWLIDKFQRDQTWYLSKARPTRDEYDLSFKIIGALYGPIKVKFLEVQHCQSLYAMIQSGDVDGEIEGDGEGPNIIGLGSVHKANKVFKAFHRLLRYAKNTGQIQHNPATGLERVSTTGRFQTYSRDEVELLVDACLNPEAYWTEEPHNLDTKSKIRHLVTNKSGVGYGWSPTAPMKKAGFEYEGLGRDLKVARERALELNAEWDEVRNPSRMPSRKSIAMAILLSYETSLPRQDVLDLRYDKFNNEKGAFRVWQIKERGNQELFLPIRPSTIEMMNENGIPFDKSQHIIINEETGEPWEEKLFSKAYLKVQRLVGLRKSAKAEKAEDDALKDALKEASTPKAEKQAKEAILDMEKSRRTFHDIRRTACSEMGSVGGTVIEIASHSGHAYNSGTINTYVHPDTAPAMSIFKKRWGLQDQDENNVVDMSEFGNKDA